MCRLEPEAGDDYWFRTIPVGGARRFVQSRRLEGVYIIEELDT